MQRPAGLAPEGTVVAAEPAALPGRACILEATGVQRLTTRTGLSLVEVTIILLVLMLLAGVLAPSIVDFVKDAQWVKVKEDCEAISVSVVRAMRDVPPCFRLVGTEGCTVNNRVDLLWSDGTTAGVIGPLSSARTHYTLAGGNARGPLNWDTGVTAQDGSMEQHLVRNSLVMPYPVPGVLYPDSVPVGPHYGIGWRGPYLSAPIGPDPWGQAYMVNSVFLTAAVDGVSPGEGQNGLTWNRDVFCISAGPDRMFETYFGGCLSTTQFGTCREGDDWITVIQGGTR
jgi:hypothetical protein